MMGIMLPNVHSTESGMDLTIKANKNSDTISITGFISNNENDVTFKAITPDRMQLIHINQITPDSNCEFFTEIKISNFKQNGMYKIKVNHGKSLPYTVGLNLNVTNGMATETFATYKTYVGPERPPCTNISIEEYKELQSNKIVEQKSTIIIDKSNYEVGEIIEISGIIDDVKRGIPLKIFLKNPDNITEELTILVNSNGEYSTFIIINSEYKLGEYMIVSSYNSEIFGKEIFSIQMKSQNNDIDVESISESKKNEIINFESMQKKVIPPWIKNNAGWWADGIIDDESFFLGLQFLIHEKIIQVESKSQKSNDMTNIPKWVKNNAGWWADGIIDDESFFLGLQFLIQEKIIKVESKSQKSNDVINIPKWVKNNAGWWADGIIDDESFMSGIEYLVKEKIIQID